MVDDTREGDAGDDQVGTKMKEDRRRKHEAKQVAAGFTRCIVRCHVDDVAKIKAYAAALLEKRRPIS